MCDEEFFDVSHVGANMRAYALLKVILGNIVRSPGQEKFRKLRITNEKLATDLFSNAGALPFLEKRCGFVFEQSGAEAGQSETIFLPDSIALADNIAEQLSYVEACEKRDFAAASEAALLGLRKRSLLLELRYEKCLSCVAAGELDDFLRATFLNSEAHFGEDGIARSIESARLVQLILQNAIGTLNGTCASAKVNYRRVPFSNKKAVDLLLRREGALELLIYLGGWVLRGRSSETSSLVVMWTSQEKPSSHNISVTPEDLVLGDHSSEDKLKAALDFVSNDLLTTLIETEKKEREDSYQKAREAALAERRADREKRQRQSEKARKQEELKARIARGEVSENRVSIEFAIRHLLGANKDEEK